MQLMTRPRGPTNVKESICGTRCGVMSAATRSALRWRARAHRATQVLRAPYDLVLPSMIADTDLIATSLGGVAHDLAGDQDHASYFLVSLSNG
jgi:hypothetical protein